MQRSHYVPTATGPGHASIYTGTTPAHHGIVANNWYERNSQTVINCVEDKTVFLIDGSSGVTKEVSKFSRSPKNLQSSTIIDELKLFTNNRSKAIGISIKDRGAILSAGNMADNTFWYNSNTGNFISSTYYRTDLPLWLKNFNKRNIADSLLNLTWDTFMSIQNYKNSGLDDSEMEKDFLGKKKVVFPYNLKKQRKKKYKAIDKELQESGESQISTTDQDARSVILHRNIVNVGYCVQAGCDEKHKLFVNNVQEQ